MFWLLIEFKAFYILAIKEQITEKPCYKRCSRAFEKQKCNYFVTITFSLTASPLRT